MQTRGTKLHFDTGIVSAVYDDVFVSVSSFDIQCFGSTYIRMQNRIQIGLQSDLDPIPKIEPKKLLT